MTTEVRVSGVGMTPFETDSERPLAALAAAAAEEALADAAVDPADVDALHFGNALAEPLDESAGPANALSAALGVDGAFSDRIENTSATGASTRRGSRSRPSAVSSPAPTSTGRGNHTLTTVPKKRPETGVPLILTGKLPPGRRRSHYPARGIPRLKPWGDINRSVRATRR